MHLISLVYYEVQQTKGNGYDCVKYLPAHTIHNFEPNSNPIMSVVKRKISSHIYGGPSAE